MMGEGDWGHVRGCGAPFCRRELAREKPESAVLNQDIRVIFNDLREQARSPLWTPFVFALHRSSRPVGRNGYAPAKKGLYL